MSVRFEFERPELIAGVEMMAARAGDAGPHTGYGALAPGVVAALERGNTGARDVIPTQVIVDGTLALMRNPDVAERLPLEILDRTIIARKGAKELTSRAIRRGLFIGTFAHLAAMGVEMNDEDREALRSLEYMEVLGGQAFADAMPVIGGAHRVLRRRDLQEPIGDIITRSTGLPNEASRTSTSNMIKVLKRLGYPYTLPRFLDVVASTEGPEVALTEEARDFIRRNSDPESGCPAGKIRNPYGSGTVLTRAWVEMVAVLAPEGATSKASNRQPELAKPNS